MAIRPVFLSTDTPAYFKRVDTEFEYHGGFSLQQKQRCVHSLHDSFQRDNPQANLLEISSKSDNPLGVALSAFNLSFMTNKKRKMTVETAFQGSKVFENGGPYTDLYFVSSIAAKKDPRIKDSGEVVGFSLMGKEYETEPKTYFYDWLYINALMLNQDLADQLMEYDAFTDIEFNPNRSINCQAEAVAIYVGLRRNDLLKSVMDDKGKFREILSEAK